MATYCLAGQHDLQKRVVPMLNKEFDGIVLVKAEQEYCSKCTYEVRDTVTLLKQEPKVKLHKVTLGPYLFGELQGGKSIFYREKEMILEDEDGNIIEPEG